MTPAERKAHNLRVALALAKDGWPVFALSGGKVPYKGSHGHLDASTDPEVVGAAMRQAGAVPAIAVPEGVVVVDVDPRNGGRSEAAGLDESDADVRTAGGGFHFYFAADGLRLRNGVLPGIDLKAHGSYVVAPGVVYADGRGYEGSAPARPRRMPVAARGILEAALEAHRATGAAADGEPEQMSSRDELMAWLGSLRRARMTEAEILAALHQAQADGRIVDNDESRPWTDKDLATLAREAGKWPVPDAADVPTPEQEAAAQRLFVAYQREKRRHDEIHFERSRRTDDLDPVTDAAIARPLSDVDGSPPPPLVDGRLHPTSHTIIFGAGGTGKGVIAAELAALRSKAGEPVLILDYENHPDEWRRRVERFGGLLDLVHIATPIGGEGGYLKGPVWSQADELRAYADAVGAMWTFVDSAMAASAVAGEGAMADPGIPSRYFAAMAAIGRPDVTLGHVVKSGSDPQYPFGSVYWHNYARMTWSVERRADDRDGRVLMNRKANQYPDAGTWRADWSWSSQLGPGETPGSLDWARDNRSVSDRIFAVLGEELLPIGDILAGLEADGFGPVKYKTLQTALERNFARHEGLWGKKVRARQRGAGVDKGVDKASGGGAGESVGGA